MKIPEGVTQAVEVLNRAFESDPMAVKRLFAYRSLCNKALADDPTIQVRAPAADGGVYSVSVLGLINGVFGVDERSWGFIAAQYDGVDDPFSLTGFVVLDPKDRENSG